MPMAAKADLREMDDIQLKISCVVICLQLIRRVSAMYPANPS